MIICNLILRFLNNFAAKINISFQNATHNDKINAVSHLTNGVVLIYGTCPYYIFLTASCILETDLQTRCMQFFRQPQTGRRIHPDSGSDNSHQLPVYATRSYMDQCN